MDPVSLALGIAPLCLSVFSGAKIARKKLRLLRHYDKEARRLRIRLKTQISIFLDESQLLLLEVFDDSTVEDMLGNLSSERWTSAEIDGQLRKHLGRKYEAVKDVIQLIGEQIESIDDDLSNLDHDHSNLGKLSATAHKARGAIGVVLNKSRMDQAIEDLLGSTNELRRLRKMAKATQDRKTKRTLEKKVMPQTYGLVTKYSTSFHDVFVRKWSCLNTDGVHSRHTAKLLLDADASDEHIDLRLILEYEAISEALQQKSLLLLRVRSEDLTWVETDLPTPESSSSSLDNEEPPPKVRRVRFVDDSIKASVRTAKKSDYLAAPCMKGRRSTCTPSDLCKSTDVCRDVFKPPTKPAQDACVGYFDSASNLRHRLLMTRDRESIAIQTSCCPPKSLASILNPTKIVELSVNEQLRLALRLVRSVLQFHSTPWWRENWSLADLSYFDIDTELSRSLSTLHIATKILPSTTGRDVEIKDAIEQVLPSPSSSNDAEVGDNDASLYCGIRNATMYSLGAALVQIGHWMALDADDVARVRRAAGKTSRLGPLYDRLVEQCLYCDFGFGADLQQTQLQSAIYENVVCELERMVGLLEGRTEELRTWCG